jgi:hyaluronan synthase
LRPFEKEYRHLAACLGIALILASIAAMILANIRYAEEIDLASEKLRQNPWGGFVFFAGLFFAALNAAVLLWRIALFHRYRPAPACPDESLPSCTVIVPAYNEGRQVMDTLRSLARSHYPKGKLQLIAVDDGSVDDTWTWITRAKREFKGKVCAIRLTRNQGKRHALYAGFKKSKGEVLVTVDSDSEVEPDTLRRLVSPFVRDEKIGAVAGNVRVLNRREGLIPRMLDVTFLYSFDFTRAGESVLNTVMCTPGALSAYRRPIVMALLEEWVNQTFMGRPNGIGEDRSLTNLILREGYHVHFQQDAYVYTKVPVTYRGLCRMLLRWGRSEVRENVIMSTFAFKRFRNGPMLGARVNLVLAWISITVSQMFLVLGVAAVLMNPVSYGTQMACTMGLMTSLPAGLYCWRRQSLDGLWAYFYSFFWIVMLSWITPYCLITVQNSGWMTRQVKGRARERGRLADELREERARAGGHGALVPTGG